MKLWRGETVKKTDKAKKQRRVSSGTKGQVSPLHDRFHLVVTHTGGNLETLIFLSLFNSESHNLTSCIDVEWRHGGLRRERKL